MHPKVLAVTGPHATAEVMDAVHRHVPKPHDPFVDLVPEVRAEFNRACVSVTFWFVVPRAWEVAAASCAASVEDFVALSRAELAAVAASAAVLAESVTAFT